MRSSEQTWAIGNVAPALSEAGKIPAASRRALCTLIIVAVEVKQLQAIRSLLEGRVCLVSSDGAGARARFAARVGQHLEYAPARAAQRPCNVLDATARRAQGQNLRAPRRRLG